MPHRLPRPRKVPSSLLILLVIIFALPAAAQQQTVNGTDTFPVARGKINSNFTELYTDKITSPATTTGDTMYFNGTTWVRLAKPSDGTYCLTWNLSVPSWSFCLVGGTSGQIEYNNGGVHGGFTVSGDGTLVTSTGVLTITKTAGVAFAASATTDTTSATNITTGTLPLAQLPASVQASVLPDQTSNAGKILTTNGAATSWTTAASGNVLSTDPTFFSASELIIGDPANPGSYYLAGSGIQSTDIVQKSGNYQYPSWLTALDGSIIAQGTIPAARLPFPTSTTLGGIETISCGAGQHVSSISSAGLPVCTADSGGGGGSSTGPQFALDTGSINVYAACPAGVTPPAAPTDNQMIMLQSTHTSTSTTPTFNYCTNGAVTITRSDTTALTSGAIYADARYTNLLVYHLAANKWELLGGAPIRPATYGVASETRTATDGTGRIFMTPASTADAISVLSPCANLGLPYQYMRSTGTGCAAADPPTNPGAGRVGRTWRAVGNTTLSTNGMINTGLSCGTGVVVAPTSTAPVALSMPTNGTASGSLCAVTAGSASLGGPMYAGTSIKFDTIVKMAATTTINYVLGVVGGALYNSSSPLSYSSSTYGDAVAIFRYSITAGDSNWKCVAAPNSATNPTVADSGSQGTGAVDTSAFHHFAIFIDDALSNIHWYIDGTEVCTGTTWSTAIPAGSVMTPYVGVYQTAVFGSAQNLTLTHVFVEANR